MLWNVDVKLELKEPDQNCTSQFAYQILCDNPVTCKLQTVQNLCIHESLQCSDGSKMISKTICLLKLAHSRSELICEYVQCDLQAMNCT